MQTAAQLRQLAAWLAGTDIGLLELRTPEGTLRLGRNGASPGEFVQLDVEDEGPEASPAPAPEPAIAAASCVGVFLWGHPLGAAPLVRIGERVAAGQALGLLQIGPLLLPVPAPRPGVIAAVLVATGDPVGYGTALVELHAY